MIEDKLILYYYDDGLSEDEKRALCAALDRDDVLAARYRQLELELGALAEAPATALPEDVRQRLHATLDRAADLERGKAAVRRPRSHWTSFFVGAGLATAIAGALLVAIVPRLQDPALPASAPVPVAAERATSGTEPVFARAMQVYFQDSRAELEGLPDGGNGERTALIMDLVTQNRVFTKLALQNGAPDLARVLRAFEPILTRLAADDITAEESEALRAKLAFELNVMLTKLTREASEYTTSTEQET